MRTIRERLEAKIQRIPFSGCMIWMGHCDKNGYGLIAVNGKKSQGAHRVSYTEAYGAPKNFVCHTCDVPSCINPEHLYDGTNSDNMQDRSRRGRANKAKGALHGKSKYTEEDVKCMREMRLSGKTLRQIADAYGAKSTGNIWHIVSGKTWRTE